MREKNPDLTAGEKKKFVMKPPQVARAGSKKTAFANFAEICRLLKRTPKHVLQFLLAELGTTYAFMCLSMCQGRLFSAVLSTATIV
jgi:translation initiation factor 2 subunit 2